MMRHFGRLTRFVVLWWLPRRRVVVDGTPERWTRKAMWQVLRPRDYTTFVNKQDCGCATRFGKSVLICSEHARWSLRG